MNINDKIKIFGDGAILEDIEWLINKYKVKGFTTNPTLMKSAGVMDYMEFAEEMLQLVDGLPLSLEVFDDEFDEMERQANKLAELGENVYVKIPITNTRAEPSYDLINRLNQDGVQLNVTAIFTKEQIKNLVPHLQNSVPSIVSVFAGRIADTGLNPVPYLEYAIEQFKENKYAEILWASPRQIYNIIEAVNAQCHIITVQNSLLPKIINFGKDLSEFSLDTVKMFYNDAIESGYKL
ncbi:MAG: transaldolase [Bacteroidetes bacterium]|nr:transaldolase [Bacteroidota bacterium]